MDNRLHGQRQPEFLTELFAEPDESTRGYSDNSDGHILRDDLFAEDCGVQIEFAFPAGPTHDDHWRRIICPVVLRTKQTAESGLQS